MNLVFWGTRGSIATPGAETAGYGGETSCVSVASSDSSHLLILDAGSGLRRLGPALSESVTRIDLLLTHLHLDHIVGLGFFSPLFRPGLAITIWGPRATTPLLDRLGRYLSPPLFPVRLRDLECDLRLEVVPDKGMHLGDFVILSEPVIHPDPALGYRIESGGKVVAYFPDHEPALGPSFPLNLAWTSGASIAEDADLLIHDSQYTAEEYPDRVGWGHSAATHAVAFADLAKAKTLAVFHHDPSRDDRGVDDLIAEARAASQGVEVIGARDGDALEIA